MPYEKEKLIPIYVYIECASNYPKKVITILMGNKWILIYKLQQVMVKNAALAYT